MPLIAFPADLQQPEMRALAMRRAIEFYRLGGRPTWEQYQQMSAAEVAIFLEAHERVAFAEATMRATADIGAQAAAAADPAAPTLMETAYARQARELAEASANAAGGGEFTPPAPIAHVGGGAQHVYDDLPDGAYIPDRRPTDPGGEEVPA